MSSHTRGRAAVAATALLSLLAACGGSKEAAAKADSTTAAPARALVLGAQDVAVARLAEVGAGVTLSGSLDPAEIVQVKSQIPGTVRRLRVDRGTAVRRGQTLMIIEAAGIQSQAAGARAGVASANAQLALARQRLEAARKLHEAGAMSKIDFASAQAAFEAAEAQTASARAQAATAGEAASRATVTAPIGGVVSDRRVSEGEAVGANVDLVTIVDASVLELAGKVGVAEAARVRVGQPVVFSLDAVPGEEFRGRVVRIDPTADPGTRQVGIYVELRNPGGRIVGGQFARGRVLGAGAAAAASVVIPTAAVREGEGGTHVLVVENGRIARRAVTLGQRDDAAGIVAVMAGVAAGDRVITSPVTDVAPGTPVTLPAGDAPSATATPAAPAKTTPNPTVKR